MSETKQWSKRQAFLLGCCLSWVFLIAGVFLALSILCLVEAFGGEIDATDSFILIGCTTGAVAFYLGCTHDQG